MGLTTPGTTEPKPKSMYRTVALPLKSVIRFPATNMPIIQNYVHRVHEIVILTYQFIRAYYLHLMQNDLPFPPLNSSLCFLVMGIVTQNKKKGGRVSNDVNKQNIKHQLKTNLEKFYIEDFRPSLPVDHIKPSMDKLSSVLQSVSIEMETCYYNNLSTRFLSRLKRWVHRSIQEDNLVPFLSDDTKKSYSLRKAGLIRRLWNGLYDKDPSLVPKSLKSLYDIAVDNYLPNDPYNKNLSYDVKAHPNKYLLPSMRLNKYFESKGWKLFQPLCLRKTSIPCHIPINLKSLIYLMDYSQFSPDLSQSQLIVEAKKQGLQDEIWNYLFKLDNPVFRQKGYAFYHRIDTDGVKCSITFILEQYRHMRFKPNPILSEKEFTLLSSLSDEELNEMKDCTLLGGDPGKNNMIQLVDGKGKKLRYTCIQRDRESYLSKMTKQMNKVRRDLGLIELEKGLNEEKSQTMNLSQFKSYLKQKWFVLKTSLCEYKNIMFRKSRMRKFLYGRKSMDRFLDKVEYEFGSQIVIGWGNWSRQGGLKGCRASLGKGLRRLIEKRYRTVTIDEYNTSRKCHWCKKDLVHKKRDGQGVYRCLKCDGCQNREGNLGVHRHINRDINGSLNIRECLFEWIHHKKRPESLSRVDISLDEKSIQTCAPEKFERNKLDRGINTLIKTELRVRKKLLRLSPK